MRSSSGDPPIEHGDRRSQRRRHRTSASPSPAHSRSQPPKLIRAQSRYSCSPADSWRGSDSNLHRATSPSPSCYYRRDSPSSMRWRHCRDRSPYPQNHSLPYRHRRASRDHSLSPRDCSPFHRVALRSRGTDLRPKGPDAHPGVVLCPPDLRGHARTVLDTALDLGLFCSNLESQAELKKTEDKLHLQWPPIKATQRVVDHTLGIYQHGQQPQGL